MRTSYIVKTNDRIMLEQAQNIVEFYEQSLSENKVFVVKNDIELYKLKRGKYIKVF